MRRVCKDKQLDLESDPLEVRDCMSSLALSFYGPAQWLRSYLLNERWKKILPKCCSPLIFLESTFFPMRKTSEMCHMVYSTCSCFCLVTQGTHQPMLAVAGSWVQAEASWPWLISQVSNHEAKFCFSPVFSSILGKECYRSISRGHLIQPAPNTVETVKAGARLSWLCLWCTIPGQGFCCPFSRIQVGLNGVVKIGWVDLPGMPGGGPFHFIIPHGIGRDPGALVFWFLTRREGTCLFCRID